MNIEELKVAIEESLNSKYFIFLPPLEDRLTELLAFAINKDESSYKAITQFPYKSEWKGNASYIDLVCFKKDESLWKSDQILWALESKLFSPHQTRDMDKYLSKSMWGPEADKEKLKNLKIKRFFILLYQFEIIRIPSFEKEESYVLETILESYPILRYLGKSEDNIKKNIDSITGKVKALIKKCEDTFKKENTVHGCSDEIKISKGKTEFSIKIHYILNEVLP